MARATRAAAGRRVVSSSDPEGKTRCRGNMRVTTLAEKKGEKERNDKPVNLVEQERQEVGEDIRCSELLPNIHTLT